MVVSLVSWSVSIAGVLYSKYECRHGSEVFRDEMFQEVKYVLGVVYSLLFIREAGGGGVGYIGELLELVDRVDMGIDFLWNQK